MEIYGQVVSGFIQLRHSMFKEDSVIAVHAVKNVLGGEMLRVELINGNFVDIPEEHKDDILSLQSWITSLINKGLKKDASN